MFEVMTVTIFPAVFLYKVVDKNLWFFEIIYHDNIKKTFHKEIPIIKNSPKMYTFKKVIVTDNLKKY